MELKLEQKDGWLDRSYHIPHNAVHAAELELLLRAVADHPRVPFDELCNLFFLYQTQNEHFEFFHEKPYRCFVSDEAPDLKSLERSLGSRAKALSFARERSKNFKKFVNGRMSVGDLMMKPYKANSTWKRVWSEYARDYARFAVLLGFVKKDRNNAYSLTDLGKAFIAKPRSLPAALMDMELATRVRRQKLAIRPFRLVLAALEEMKKAGKDYVPSILLMYYLSHLKGEQQFPMLLRELKKHSGKFLAQKVAIEEKLARKAQRFGLPVRRFLDDTGLVKEGSLDGNTVLAITAKGSKLASASAKSGK